MIEDGKILYSLLGIALFGVFYFSGKAIIRLFGNARGLKFRRQEILSKFLLILTVISYCLFLFSLWSVEVKNIWIFASSVLGIFGIALFASWSILSNIVAAFVLFFTVPFRSGDRIEIWESDHLLEGVVEDLTLFYIFIKTDDNKIINLPNTLALQKIIIRHSSHKAS